MSSKATINMRTVEAMVCVDDQAWFQVTGIRHALLRLSEVPDEGDVGATRVEVAILKFERCPQVVLEKMGLVDIRE